MLIIHFIRHAESEGNIDYERIGGRQNHLKLTANGLTQAHKLQQFLQKNKDLNIVHVRSSVAQRAKKTAKIATTHLEQEIVFDERIVELHNGEWEGKPRKLMEEAIDEQKQLGNDWKAPGGESANDVIKRVLPALQEVLELYEKDVQKHVLWFGHATAIRSLVHHLLEAEHLIFRSSMHNTARTVLTWNGEHWYLHRYNDTQHLI